MWAALVYVEGIGNQMPDENLDRLTRSVMAAFGQEWQPGFPTMVHALAIDAREIARQLERDGAVIKVVDTRQ